MHRINSKQEAWGWPAGQVKGNGTPKRIYDSRQGTYSEKSIGAELLKRRSNARRLIEEREIARELGLSADALVPLPR